MKEWALLAVFRLPRLLALLLLASIFGPAPFLHGGAAPPLDEVLANVEKQGARLKSMSADIVQKKWTDLLGQFDAGESGKLLFLKQDGKIYIRKDILQPHPNQLVINEGRVVFYQPGIKQAQTHDLGANQDKAEFLLIGFGTSRKSLENAYDMKILGEESLESTDTVILELTPKSDKVSAFFARIVLWLDTRTWVPMQQKLVEPTDDYLLVSFSRVQLNPKLSKSDFELKLPKDVKIIGN